MDRGQLMDVVVGVNLFVLNVTIRNLMIKGWLDNEWLTSIKWLHLVFEMT